jgi:nucleotide-binding universal stress UspA family protein
VVTALTHVLSPVDFSDSSDRALAHAVALARRYHARVTVLHVVPTFDAVPLRTGLGGPVDIIEPWPREQVIERLQRLLDANAFSPDAIPVARAGVPAPTILEEAGMGRADLIVIGTHGRRGFKRLLLGSVAETVLREAPCPVLTVPPLTPTESSQVVAFNRILCPVDFSPSALHALDFALSLAGQSGGKVTVVHVIEWLAEEEPRTSAHFNVPEFRGHMERAAAEQLEALARTESGRRSQVENVVAFGRAHREILRLCESGRTDLIVMGAQGRGGLELALFGSTTQQVVRDASCPVLTVRRGDQT